jgi:hypothetical protein
MASSIPPRRLWTHRIGWMVLIWAGSVTGLAVVASLLRLVMKLTGMRS